MVGTVDPFLFAKCNACSLFWLLSVVEITLKNTVFNSNKASILFLHQIQQFHVFSSPLFASSVKGW